MLLLIFEPSTAIINLCDDKKVLCSDKQNNCAIINLLFNWINIRGFKNFLDNE